MSLSQPVLQAIQLNHSFGRGESLTPALREVSLELRPGQFTVLIGPSGSGKSTLLAVLSGLLRPDAGLVRVLGQDLWGLPQARREQFRLRHCGFVFQGHNLIPSLTAREQLELVVRWTGGPEARQAGRQVAAMLERLGLSRKGDLFPDQLSGGEKQLVALGRAFLKNPRLCFADEPTSALDWARGAGIVEMLRSVCKSGTAVLAVAHDPRILSHADQILHLQDGRLRK